MRNTKTGGFTLIELLIVIAIIGILAAVLIPNLLNARKRAFDTASQNCLKEIVVHEEINASNDPWQYKGVNSEDGTKALKQTATASSDLSNGINSCKGVTVQGDGVTDSGKKFNYTAVHVNGSTTYTVSNGTGVTAVAAGAGGGSGNN